MDTGEKFIRSIPQETSSVLRAQSEAEAMLISAGCTTAEIVAWKLHNQALIAESEVEKEIYESGAALARGQRFFNETPVTPTVVGEFVGQLTGSYLTPIAVNKILINLKLQERKMRPSSSGGADKPYYALTKTGQKYGVVIANDIRNNQKTVFRVRWFPSVAEVIIRHLSDPVALDSVRESEIQDARFREFYAEDFDSEAS